MTTLLSALLLSSAHAAPMLDIEAEEMTLLSATKTGTTFEQHTVAVLVDGRAKYDVERVEVCTLDEAGFTCDGTVWIDDWKATFSLEDDGRFVSLVYGSKPFLGHGTLTAVAMWGAPDPALIAYEEDACDQALQEYRDALARRQQAWLAYQGCGVEWDDLTEEQIGDGLMICVQEAEDLNEANADFSDAVDKVHEECKDDTDTVG